MTQSRRLFEDWGRGSCRGLRSRGAAALTETATNAGDCGATSQFGYGDVELLEGPLREQFDANHAFYLGLDEDSLLKPFREKAGMPHRARRWAGGTVGLRRATLTRRTILCAGAQLWAAFPGLARDYAATGDKAHRRKCTGSCGVWACDLVALLGRRRFRLYLRQDLDRDERCTQARATRGVQAMTALDSAGASSGKGSSTA
jgi:hypothetical protein